MSAEHLEELLDETERAAWASEADGEARRRLGAPTLEGMLLRMEEIQVRGAGGAGGGGPGGRGRRPR